MNSIMILSVFLLSLIMSISGMPTNNVDSVQSIEIIRFESPRAAMPIPVEELSVFPLNSRILQSFVDIPRRPRFNTQIRTRV